MCLRLVSGGLSLPPFTRCPFQGEHDTFTAQSHRGAASGPSCRQALRTIYLFHLERFFCRLLFYRLAGQADQNNFTLHGRRTAPPPPKLLPEILAESRGGRVALVSSLAAEQEQTAAPHTRLLRPETIFDGMNHPHPPPLPRRCFSASPHLSFTLSPSDTISTSTQEEKLLLIVQ